MMQYDGDLQHAEALPGGPPVISARSASTWPRPASAVAISETQKFGHVTYFWNGNRSGKFDDEARDVHRDPVRQRAVRAAPVDEGGGDHRRADRAVRAGKHRTLRVNFANGDMVGHTGNFAVRGDRDRGASTSALGAPAAGRSTRAARRRSSSPPTTATPTRCTSSTRRASPSPTAPAASRPKTSHTLNPVPCILYDNQTNGGLRLRSDKKFGLSALAATSVNLLGYDAPSDWDETLLASG